MKSDITSREDIELLLTAFYSKVFTDAVIGHFFTTVIPLNLEQHMPHIADFWESVLLDARGYRKNVMLIHQDIHQLSPINKIHLEQWVHLFTETVDELFEGNKATLAKQRATSIAIMMDMKINHPNPLK